MYAHCPAGLPGATYMDAVGEAASLTQPAQAPAADVSQPPISEPAATQSTPAAQGTPKSGGITSIFMDSLRGLLPGRASPAPVDAAKVGQALPTAVGAGGPAGTIAATHSGAPTASTADAAASTQAGATKPMGAAPIGSAPTGPSTTAGLRVGNGVAEPAG